MLLIQPEAAILEGSSPTKYLRTLTKGAIHTHNCKSTPVSPVGERRLPQFATMYQQNDRV